MGKHKTLIHTGPQSEVEMEGNQNDPPEDEDMIEADPKVAKTDGIIDQNRPQIEESKLYNYMCNICGELFFQRIPLLRHLITKKCQDTDMGADFWASDDIFDQQDDIDVEKVKGKNGVTKYKCPLCNYSAGQRTSVR